MRPPKLSSEQWLFASFLVVACISTLAAFLCGQEPVGAPRATPQNLTVIDNTSAKGAWISLKDQFLCFYVDKRLGNSPVIAIESQKDKNPGHEFAVSVQKGKVMLQVCKDGEILNVDLFDAMKKLQELSANDDGPRTVGDTKPSADVDTVGLTPQGN